MYYRTAHAAAAVIGIAALALTGCATGAEPEATTESAPPSADATPTASPEPEPETTDEPVEPTETPAAEPTETTPAETDAAACEQIAGQNNDAYGSYGDGDSLGGFPIVPLQDTGARPGAQGDAAADDEGVPASYTVAAGDNEDAIAERFCATRDYLVLLNSIRRNTSTVETDIPWPQAGSRITMMDLYEGDTLNLNPYTISSVGDQNGQAYANNPDIPMPPQQ